MTASFCLPERIFQNLSSILVKSSKRVLKVFPNFNLAMSADYTTDIVKTAIDDSQSTGVGIIDNTKSANTFAVKDEIANGRSEIHSFN